MKFRCMCDITDRSKNWSVTDSLINPSMWPTSDKVHRTCANANRRRRMLCRYTSIWFIALDQGLLGGWTPLYSKVQKAPKN